MQIVCIFISPPTQGDITFFFLLRVHQNEKINKLVGLAADLPSHRLDLNSDTSWRNSFCVLNGIQLNLITITYSQAFLQSQNVVLRIYFKKYLEAQTTAVQTAVLTENILVIIGKI